MCTAHGPVAYHSTGLFLLRLTVLWITDSSVYSGLPVGIAAGVIGFIWQTQQIESLLTKLLVQLAPHCWESLIPSRHQASIVLFFFFFLFFLDCFILMCHFVTLHSLDFSDFSRCVEKLYLVVITHVNKFVMLVPVETVLVLGKGPVHVENQVSPRYFPSKLSKCHPAFDCQQFRLLKQCKVHNKFLQWTVKAEIYLFGSFCQNLI